MDLLGDVSISKADIFIIAGQLKHLFSIQPPHIQKVLKQEIDDTLTKLASLINKEPIK